MCTQYLLEYFQNSQYSVLTRVLFLSTRFIPGHKTIRLRTSGKAGRVWPLTLPVKQLYSYINSIKTYTIAIKLSIFLYDPIFEVMKNNLSFEYYSTCTLVFWLPNYDKFD